LLDEITGAPDNQERAPAGGGFLFIRKPNNSKSCVIFFPVGGGVGGAKIGKGKPHRATRARARSS
jgi:hypothetical protein